MGIFRGENAQADRFHQGLLTGVDVEFLTDITDMEIHRRFGAGRYLGNLP